MNTKPFLIPYAKPSLDQQDIKAVSRFLTSLNGVQGTIRERFESKVAEYVGAKYAVSFNSFTSAFHAAYYACNTSSYDIVLTTPNTFIGAIAGAVLLGSKIAFVDIEEKTAQMDLMRLPSNLTKFSSRGKYILVPEHFGGRPFDVASLEKKLAFPEAKIIENAKNAFGASYRDGTKVGSCEWSDMTVFDLGADGVLYAGEGGCVTTNNPEYFEKLMLFRNNGIAPSNNEAQIEQCSGDFTFSEIHASLALGQIDRLDLSLKQRRHLAKHYAKKLHPIAGVRMIYDSYYNHTAGYGTICCILDYHRLRIDKSKVLTALQQLGIQAQDVPKSLNNCQALHSNIRREDIEYRYAEKFTRCALYLPFFTDMTEAQVDEVCHKLNKVLHHKSR